MRAQEAQRLQSALQERSRLLRVAELEIQRIRAGNLVRAAAGAAPPPAGSSSPTAPASPAPAADPTRST